MDGKVLTERQTRFAEEHYDVLTDFLEAKGLVREEYYDALVFKFLRAVQLYDESRNLKKYSFDFFAAWYLQKMLGEYIKQKEKNRREEVVLSLDYPLSYNTSLTLMDVIPDERVNVCDEVCEKISRMQRMHRLSHRYPSRCRAWQMELREVV